MSQLKETLSLLSVPTSSFDCGGSWRPQGLGDFSSIKGTIGTEAGLEPGLPCSIPGLHVIACGLTSLELKVTLATPLALHLCAHGRLRMHRLRSVPPLPAHLAPSPYPAPPPARLSLIKISQTWCSKNNSFLTKRGKATVFQPHGLSSVPKQGVELNNKSSRAYRIKDTRECSHKLPLHYNLSIFAMENSK